MRWRSLCFEVWFDEDREETAKKKEREKRLTDDDERGRGSVDHLE